MAQCMQGQQRGGPWGRLGELDTVPSALLLFLNLGGKLLSLSASGVSALSCRSGHPANMEDIPGWWAHVV